MRQTRVFESKCPQCHECLSGATDPVAQAVPKPGDMSVCAYCSALLVFNDDESLRLATRDDIAELDASTAFKLGMLRALVSQMRSKKQQ